MRKWTITTTFLMVFILGVLSIYWGALFRVEQNLHKLNVYVVDFDGRAAPYNTSGVQPVVGPAIVLLSHPENRRRVLVSIAMPDGSSHGASGQV